MTKSKAENLLKKYKAGQCTPEETRLVESWYNAFSATVEAPSSTPDIQLLHDEGLRKILDADRRKYRAPFYRVAMLASAAALLLFLGVSLYFYRDNDRDEIKDERIAEVFIPGGNKATLTLANGEQYELAGQKNGIRMGDDIVYEDGSTVTSLESIMPAEGLNASLREELITLSTPVGGTYHVVLADGSRVRLNAGSKLIYPSKFVAGERKVQLEGEAYFQVTSDKQKPFIVVSEGQEIQVLGTEFNISTYSGYEEVQTTLVEGSVKVRTSLGDESASVVLQPGEQSTLRAGKFDVRQVDVSNVVAWTEGKFSFSGKEFKQIMDEVSRWYDLQVIYQGGVPKDRLVGDAYRH